jgi:hypothetical protein
MKLGPRFYCQELSFVTSVESGDMLRAKRFGVAGLIAALAMLSGSPGSAQPAQVPDFSGLWSRATFGFEPPTSGAGPIRNLLRQPDGTEDRNRTVGDFHNPILKPEAAAVVQRDGKVALSGADYPTPNNQCRPMASPYILRVQGMEMLQQHHQVTMLYAQDHQFRTVRLNRPHPARVIPSWHGDSIGHYERDTLVVDTIGVKVGPAAMVDTYGTPFSDALHVVERYRLIDYGDAKRAQELGLKEYGPPATAQAVTVDREYRGKGLQVQFTVDDRNLFTTPWSATATYLRSRDGWVENVCAENIHEYYGSHDADVPHAATPDF